MYQAHDEVVSAREDTIRDLSAKYQLKGFDHSPLEKEKIIDFITRITDLQRQQNNDTDHLQVKYIGGEWSPELTWRMFDRRANKEGKMKRTTLNQGSFIPRLSGLSNRRRLFASAR